MYRGPGAPATGPRHHYMFEIYALDMKLDVQPAADAFETRANVFRAMQGRFDKVASRKPGASRTESREIYLYGKGFKGGG